MVGFDWPALMCAGLQTPQAGGLGLLPEQFWQLTPRELSLMLGRASFQTPMGRARLDELVRSFPDRNKGELK